jgi:ArsR family transcriptional regulator, arsenate/arsenite/antimonite-responsive transcriptional repressor
LTFLLQHDNISIGVEILKLERRGLPMQEAYKAIADPTRRRILKYLRGGERTAGELAEYANVGRTALSHHLMVLKLADLVRVERRGQFQVYTLNTTVLQDLMTELLGWFGGTEAPADDKLSLAAESENETDVSKEDTV